MPELHSPRIAILASGGGSTAEAFIHATQDKRIDAEVGLVVCSKPPTEAGIYERVERLNTQYGLDIEVVNISGITHPGGPAERGQTDAESEAICKKVTAINPDHVALMGYMRVVRGSLLREYGWNGNGEASLYAGKMTNTHPGILPQTADTFGAHASQMVLDEGLDQTAHTVHLVSAGIDTGPILASTPIDVLPEDTTDKLFGRVQDIEKAVLPWVIGKFLIEQRIENTH